MLLYKRPIPVRYQHFPSLQHIPDNRYTLQVEPAEQFKVEPADDRPSHLGKNLMSAGIRHQVDMLRAREQMPWG
jgi:hypothetical protein